ncbi:hypothetical protein CRG98_038938 [Punica granatum]|uniref:RNase H type-1 domain-containing protein n=1 Tax=Punica granatum TaxID=22663 RepID=A0A2I0IA54_PUNGR|nr:hypothetical protein CRG98_038938 [Punica granatum]
MAHQLSSGLIIGWELRHSEASSTAPYLLKKKADIFHAPSWAHSLLQSRNGYITTLLPLNHCTYTFLGEIQVSLEKGDSFGIPWANGSGDFGPVSTFDVIIPKHTYREANKCVDHLANLGAEQLDDLVTLPLSPPSIRQFLFDDIRGFPTPVL